jgi:hypothetical protein
VNDLGYLIMIPFSFFAGTLSKDNPEDLSRLILPVNKQIKAWHKANRRMKWGINHEAFERIEPPPALTEEDRDQGFIGVTLYYGFGDDGSGNADAVLSGKLAWEYAVKYKRGRTWQCEYIDFNRSDDIRLRPGAPVRPKGFYFAKFQSGGRFQSSTVSHVRKNLGKATGFGPEGIQFLAITHRHFQNLMNKRKIPFMALADYDVAPYGYNDFFDAMQLFHSVGVFGLGIGNVDRNYPLFGIPTILLQSGAESDKEKG